MIYKIFGRHSTGAVPAENLVNHDIVKQFRVRKLELQRITPHRVEHIRDVPRVSQAQSHLGIQPPNMSEHFPDSELACKCGKDDCVAIVRADTMLIERLEDMRAKYNGLLQDAHPGVRERGLVITSGIRCPEHNRAVGGSPTSSHLGGWAVDLRVRNGADMILMAQSAIDAGFRRIGVSARHGQPYFIHLDVDPTKPDAMWSY